MAQDHKKWLPIYYQDYVGKATKAGIPVLGKDEWAAKYLGNGSSNVTYDRVLGGGYDVDYEGARVTFEREAAPILTEKINKLKKQAHDWNPAVPFTAYSGATDFDSIYDALTRTEAETNANRPKNIKDDGTVDDTIDPTTGKAKYVFKPTEIMEQSEEGWQTEIGYMRNPKYTEGGTEPEYIKDVNYKDPERPEYKYDPTLEAKYFKQISEADEQGTRKAVNRVNEQANFLNPYATGSGSQLQAVSSMMDEITANQMSRAFSLGMNEYDRNYTGKYADYEKEQAKKTAARSGLLALSEYYARMANEADSKNEGNYWKGVGMAYDTSLADRQREAEDRRYQRDTDLMGKAFEMSKPREQDWWEPFVGAAVGGLTGGLGGAVAGGVSNIASGKKWGYNPYEELIRYYTGGK